MSLQCPSSPVYHTSAQQKLQSKNAAKLYRYGSPKIRDLLREKCRLRIRESRRTCHEKGRDVNNSFMRKLEILREEVAEVEQNIELQEAIYKELLDEVNDLFAEQLEEEETYAISAAENNDIVCPICQKATLLWEPMQPYQCQCGISFHFNGNPDQLRETLHQKINSHEQNCLQSLTFFSEPRPTGANVLSAMCAACDYFCSL